MECLPVWVVSASSRAETASDEMRTTATNARPRRRRSFEGAIGVSLDLTQWGNQAVDRVRAGCGWCKQEECWPLFIAGRRPLNWGHSVGGRRVMVSQGLASKWVPQILSVLLSSFNVLWRKDNTYMMSSSRRVWSFSFFFLFFYKIWIFM